MFRAYSSIYFPKIHSFPVLFRLDGWLNKQLFLNWWFFFHIYIFSLDKLVTWYTVSNDSWGIKHTFSGRTDNLTEGLKPNSSLILVCDIFYKIHQKWESGPTVCVVVSTTLHYASSPTLRLVTRPVRTLRPWVTVVWW